MMSVLVERLSAILPALFVALAALGLNLPWPVEPDVRVALPFLALPLIHWPAYRAPGRLPPPLVLVAGILADLAAGTPLGFSALLYLGVLAAGRGMRPLVGGRVWGGFIALPVAASVAFATATLVPLAFTLRWPQTPPILAGIGLSFLLEAIGLLLAWLPSAVRASSPSGAA